MALRIYKKLSSAADSTYVLHTQLADGVTSELASGLIPDTGYTFKIIREVGGQESVPVIVSATTQATPNTTPAAPTATADDTANTLSFSHALGNSEIVVSENSGAYAAYAGPISVGNVVRAAGYWKAKIKAATGRNESAVTDSPAFTVPANVTPVANAGADNAITLPTNSVTLVGSGTDSDGTIATYLWEQTIGAPATITTPSAATTTVTGLAEGTYEFRLTVTDNQGATHQDTVQITVLAPTTVYGVAIAGQSNGSGLAPQTALSTAQKGPFSKVLIWNDDANAAQSLQIGVNEAGLNGGLTDAEPRADGATIPAGLENYYDGFGFEQRFGELWQANKTDNSYYFKMNVERPMSTNGSSIAYWQSDIFAAYETQYNRMKAKLAAEGKTLVTEYFLWNQGESDSTNVNYVADLNSLMTRFKTLFNNPSLKIIVVKTVGSTNQYAAVGARQLDYVLQEPAAQLIVIPNHTYLSDGIHTDAASMITGGGMWYNMAYGAKDVTVPTVTSRSVFDATTIRVVYSEPVLGDLTGVSFTKNGAALTPTAMAGNGTTTIDYTVPAVTTGDVITHTYDATTGKIIDFSRNKLTSFTGQAVSNGGDLTAPVLQSATTRVENEYSTPNQLVLTYNEPLLASSVPVNADITITPANTLSSAAVSGNDMVLTFANDFAAKTAITLSTANGKIKDMAGNAAANLASQTVNNWIAALMGGWSFVPMPVTPGMTSTNNFWRTSSRNVLWGNGNRIGMKLPAGVDGGIAQHYVKPDLAGGIGFKPIDNFETGLVTPASSKFFDGYFIDINHKLTWTRGSTTPTAAILQTAVLGNWYRVWRTANVLTLDESADGTTWTTLFTFPNMPGDIFAMFDIVGHADSKIQYLEHQGLVAV